MKKRREQREAERAAMAEELEMIQRERAIAEAAELEKKEEEVGGGRRVRCARTKRTWPVLGRRAMPMPASTAADGCAKRVWWW